MCTLRATACGDRGPVTRSKAAPHAVFVQTLHPGGTDARTTVGMKERVALPLGARRLQKGWRPDAEAGDPRPRVGGGCCASKGGVAIGFRALPSPHPVLVWGARELQSGGWPQGQAVAPGCSDTRGPGPQAWAAGHALGAHSPSQLLTEAKGLTQRHRRTGRGSNDLDKFTAGPVRRGGGLRAGSVTPAEGRVLAAGGLRTDLRTDGLRTSLSL